MQLQLQPAVRYATAAAVLLAVTLLPGARAASERLTPGTYATTITLQDIPSSFPPEFVDILVGEWQLQFTDTGAAFAMKDGEIVVVGRYVSNPARLVFHDEGGPLACTLPGTQTAVYGWVLQNGQLTMTEVQDRCGGRALVMTAHPLQKVQ